MKKILLIAQYTQLPGEKGNNRSRFKLIAEMLVKKGYEVTVVTSKFRELDRTYRSNTKVIAPYKIIILDENGYQKNISLKRVYSMWTFSNNLKKFLKNSNEKYDLIYSCIPGLDSGLVAGKYAKKNKIPFIIDIQDLWPEAMYDLILDLPIISRVLFFPLEYLANRVYQLADGIIGVSKTYMEVAIDKSYNYKRSEYVYIGTDLDSFDRYEKKPKNFIEKIDGEFWISYIGSLGHSYDIKTFTEAIKLLNNNGINVRGIIIGDGPLKSEFEDHARIIDSNMIFTGWIIHEEMKMYLSKSDAVINAIKKKAPQSITNKIGDYLSSGKPVLNGSLNIEFLEMVKEYEFGINYTPENINSMANAIKELVLMNEDKRNIMGKNGRLLAEQKFDRKKTYPKIVGLVEELLA